jgi:hypothetical protein
MTKLGADASVSKPCRHGSVIDAKQVQKGDLGVNVVSMPIAELGMANMLKLSPA